MRIEEQGKYLQMMFEKQSQSSTEKVQDPSSRDTAAKPSSTLNQSANKDSGATMDPNRTGDRAKTAELGERSSGLGVKQKLVEIESDTEGATDDGSKISQEARCANCKIVNISVAPFRYSCSIRCLVKNWYHQCVEFYY